MTNPLKNWRMKLLQASMLQESKDEKNKTDVEDKAKQNKWNEDVDLHHNSKQYFDNIIKKFKANVIF